MPVRVQERAHFSQRTAWATQENNLTIALEARRRAHRPMIDLTLSNPTKASLNYPQNLLETMSSGDSLQYKPEPLGLLEAREKLVDWYRHRGQHRLAHRTMLTASSSESYSYLFHLLADPGDEILIPAPSYPLFSFLADLANVQLCTYPLRYDGSWYVDLEALRSKIHARTRAILVVSPNNPTGSFLCDEEADALRSIAGEHGLALISDEVFAEYPLGSRQGQSLGNSDACLTFVLGGLSKLAGLPQLKLGWIFVHGPEDQVSTAMERLETIADTFLSVSTPVQRALPSLLAAADFIGDQIRARTRENLCSLQALLQDTVATVLNAEGGWYAVVQLPAIRSEEEWTMALLDRDVIVHPGHFFDFDREPFLVLSLLPRPEEMNTGVTILRKMLEELT